MPPSKHAVLSASGAHRWLHCNPSARLELEFADRETEAAAEGTAAHALAEHKLKKALKLRSRKPVSPYDCDEMDAYTDGSSSWRTFRPSKRGSSPGSLGSSGGRRCSPRAVTSTALRPARCSMSPWSNMGSTAISGRRARSQSWPWATAARWGRLKAMGALNYGLTEEELKPLVDAWRQSNPRIVKFWWDVDRAAATCVRDRVPAETHGIRFFYQSGMMFIVLPSGRKLVYVKPKMGVNRYGSESVTYEGVGEQKKVAAAGELRPQIRGEHRPGHSPRHPGGSHAPAGSGGVPNRDARP